MREGSPDSARHHFPNTNRPCDVVTVKCFNRNIICIPIITQEIIVNNQYLNFVFQYIVIRRFM